MQPLTRRTYHGRLQEDRHLQYFRFSAGCGPTSLVAGSSVVAAGLLAAAPQCTRADRKHQLALMSHSSLSFSRLAGSACACLQPQRCLIREHCHTELVEPTLVHSLTEKTRGSTLQMTC